MIEIITDNDCNPDWNDWSIDYKSEIMILTESTKIMTGMPEVKTERTEWLD